MFELLNDILIGLLFATLLVGGISNRYFCFKCMAHQKCLLYNKIYKYIPTRKKN